MKIIVSGSRHFFGDMGIIYDKLDEVLSMTRGVPTYILHGEATGIDSVVEKYIKDRPDQGLIGKKFHAKWDMFGDLAGPIRNAKMVAEADAFVAFPWVRENKGTTDLITKASMMNLRNLGIFEMTGSKYMNNWRII